ncbi:protein HEG homolog 1 isoform X2 [Esox lucius]|uniref:protein HEG homolog 1 isoform X2 n=1 Tax=Esox lucius TaxID=8010 RepID=UPI0014774FD7|nr:protein HEG homolog 1 isoform X2 [Esox lucius]
MTPQTPNTGTPQTPNTMTPQTPNTGAPQSPNTENPQTPNTGTQQTPNTGTPQTPNTGTPQTPITGTQQTPNTGTSQTPNTGTPQTSNTGTPQTPNTGTPQTPNTMTPQTSNTMTPQTSNTMTPQTSNTGTPQTPNTGTPQTPNTMTPQTSNTMTPQTPNTDTDQTQTTTSGTTEPNITTPGIESTPSPATAGTSGISTSGTSETPLPPFHTSPTGGTTTHPESAITTSLPPPVSIACPSTPCPFDSLCLNGTCQCLSGTYLSQGRCLSARVFPGQLHLNQTFKAEMSNRSSEIFMQTAARISEALRGALKEQPGYIQTDVVQLRQGSVIAMVNNMFEQGSNATQNMTDAAIVKAIKECGTTCGTVLESATFTHTDLCEQVPLPCDIYTTACSFKDGFSTCFCKPGYINSLYSNKSCTACPSGQRADGDMCVPCSFGYAGFNCTDSALLAVVVVACVLGGVLLLLLVALLVYYCWRCGSPLEKKSSADFNSPYLAEDFRGSWSNVQGITPIPRASTNWDPAPIEMTEGGSMHTLVDKKPHTNGAGICHLPKWEKRTGSYDITSESLNTFTGKNPSRYSYLVQGHENPYFVPGDEKRTL